MLKYLLIILGNDSTSFCYYKNKTEKKSEFIPVNTLKDAIDFANKNNLFINFLCGNERLPDKYEKLIDSIDHVKIVPLSLGNAYDNSMIIMESGEMDSISGLKKVSNSNIILRLEKKDLSRFSEIFNSLSGKFKRLNLNLIDIYDYTAEDIEEYKKQLEKISENVISKYKKNESFEMNFLSDRLLLNKMNNCNAGIEHVTIAPNGKFYICPGFYYDDVKDDIGDIKNGINIKNGQLLDLNNAPICSICDAYQCKRCVYLNKRITMELNTPSFQQCVLSHHERNASKRILDILKNTPGFTSFDNINLIEEINYVDPLKVLTGEVKKQLNEPKPQKTIQSETQDAFIVQDGDKTIKIPKLQMAQRENNSMYKSVEEFIQLSTKDMLIEIYKIQKEILKEFNK